MSGRLDSEQQPDSIVDAQKRARLNNPILQAEETFGNYRVVKCLSAGLLAHYYQMQHIRDRHDVTVGVFHPRANGKEKFIKRLQLLKKEISGLGHEAIPKIRDCLIVDGRVCLFQDPVKGHTLSQYFEAHGDPGRNGVGVSVATRLIAQLLGALGFAHAQGIDHRDLDSDLIYVQEDGSVRILGIGVKAAMGIELFESIVSASVSPLEAQKKLNHLSSFDVMSPEYRSGVAEDSRVDIYAVGVIGYWLLTAHKPEAAKYKKPTEFIDGLLPSWNVFFEQSLARDTGKRFQSCKMALIGLKKTEIEPTSEGSGYIQKQIDRIPVPKGILERGALASRIYRLILIGLVGVSLTAAVTSFISRSFSDSRDAEAARAAALAEAAAAKAAQESEQSSALVDLEVRSEPGASVFLLDAEGERTLLGETDESGLVKLPEALPPGEYGFSVEKAGYRAQTVSAHRVEAGELSVIEADLEVAPVEAFVVSQPERARVRLDGVDLGRTPLQLEGLQPGQSYAIELQKEGYRPTERRVSLEVAETRTIDFGGLIPLAGSVRAEVRLNGAVLGPTDPLRSDMMVRIDDEVMPLSDTAFTDLPVGTTRFELDHPLYTSDAIEIDIKDGERQPASFDLQARPGAVVLSVPAGVEPVLRIDGQAVGLDEEDRAEVPAARAVDLELEMKDYLTMRRQLELSPTEVFVWEVNPVPVPGPQKASPWSVPYIGIDFAWVPPGAFTMGSPLSEHARLPEEGPQTEVRFTRGIWVGVYEVTQQQFRAVAGSEPSDFRGENRPVESLSWEQANDFCRTLTQIERDAGRLPEGYSYRLPSEAEWEYAARAGTATPFHWGSEADATLGQFNGVYPKDRVDGLRSPLGGYGTTDVGQFAPNAFGLYDMHGNVREWTLDAFRSRLPGGELVDPAAREAGNRIAIRGGGWEDTAARVRSAAREQSSPGRTSNALGFRVVLAPER